MALLAVAMLALGAAACRPGQIELIDDVVPITVTSVSPANLTTNVAQNSVVTVQFSREVACSTVTSSSFMVSSPSDNIPGTITCNGSVATFTPAAPLSLATRYSVVLTTDVRGIRVRSNLREQFYSAFNTAVCTTACSVGGRVSDLSGTGLVLQLNGGEALAIDRNGNYTFATTLASGQSYAVSVQTQPGNPAQTCTVLNAAGVIANDHVRNVDVVCKSARYAFVVNNYEGGTGRVSSYAVDAVTGRMRFIARADTGVSPQHLSADPAGQYVYVANQTSNSVSQYSVSPNGALVPMSTPAVPAGSAPKWVAVHPGGRFAYVANRLGNTVSQYAIGTDGALTPLATPAANAGAAPASIAIEPAGRYAYVVNRDANSISQYAIGTDGALTPLSPASIATVHAGPIAITVDPRGQFAYVAHLVEGGNYVSRYLIGPSGTLTAQPALIATGATAPRSVTIDPTGRYAYVAGDGPLVKFAVNYYSGDLSQPVNASLAGGATQAEAVAVDPSGHFAYAVNRADGISQFTIDANGNLVANTPAYASTPHPGPLAMVITSGANPVRPRARNVYVTNGGDSSLSQYSVGSSGALSALSPATVTGYAALAAITADPERRFAYAAYAGDLNNRRLIQYTVAADGALTERSGTGWVVSPTAVTTHPARRCVYVVTSGDFLGQYELSSTDGMVALSPATLATGAGPKRIVVDPSGQYVYVVNSGSGNVSVFRNYDTNPDYRGCRLYQHTPVPIAAGSLPEDMVIHPSARFAYVVNRGDGTISQYSMDAGGNLAPMATPTIAVGTGLMAMDIEPSGRFAYVASRSGSSVLVYAIHAGTGALTLASDPDYSANSPSAISADPSGQYVYLTEAGGNRVSYFTINPATGALTYGGFTNTGTGPGAIAVTGEYQ